MTTVLDRAPARQIDDTGPTRAQLWAKGAMSAVSTAAVTMAVLLVLVLVAWAADPRSGGSAGSAARVAVGLWLLAARVPLHVTGGWVALPPLGLTLVTGAMLARCASSLLAWRSGDDVVVDLRTGTAAGSAPTVAAVSEVVASVAVPFAVVGGVMAAVARDSAMQPSLLWAPVLSLLFAAGAGWVGTRRAGWARLPLPAVVAPLRPAAGSAARAASVLAGGGVLLLVGATAWHADDVLRLAGQTGGGPVADAGLALVCLALVPNAVVAAMGYLIGAPVSVGTGTAVGLGGAHLGALPPVPLLAALPHGAAPLPVRVASWLVLLAAAAMAMRGVDLTLQLRSVAGRAAATVGLCALCLGLATALSGGPAGPGRLATVGVPGVQVFGLLLGELGLAVALVVGGRWLWERYRPARDE